MIMGDKPAYSVWPHSVRPLRRLAGGRAPSDPPVSGPPLGAAGGGMLHPRTPSPVPPPGVSPSWAGIRPTRSSRSPPAGNSVATGEAVSIHPQAESLADRVAPEPRNRVEPGKPSSRRFWAFGGRLRGIRGRETACNARTRPPEGSEYPRFRAFARGTGHRRGRGSSQKSGWRSAPFDGPTPRPLGRQPHRRRGATGGPLRRPRSRGGVLSR